MVSQLQASGASAQIVVEDTGPGIPAPLLGKIFEPFFTTRGAGEGAGLGLPLCAAILKEHGGRIRAVSRPEGGARFELELPLAGTGKQPPATGSALRLLVVDDQQAVADFVASALALDGYEVEVALGGEAASRRLREAEYDLVLMDLNMPDLRGESVYAEAQRAGSRAAFAVMTADAVSEDAAAFLARTHLPTLAKPFTLEALRAFVRPLLASLPIPAVGAKDETRFS
jgi:CheY-like chemotaxis protein